MEGCKYCSENDNATIKRVVVTYEYTNPTHMDILKHAIGKKIIR